ncbi:hypothetical protein BGZ63DRAFT_128484 [Mariannaea sp. PMI_226]|nr:hypothetical protein BGZ63DRAFT_128484 [Mariannaea sp. PMI_226]
MYPDHQVDMSYLSPSSSVVIAAAFLALPSRVSCSLTRCSLELALFPCSLACSSNPKQRLTLVTLAVFFFPFSVLRLPGEQSREQTSLVCANLHIPSAHYIPRRRLCCWIRRPRSSRPGHLLCGMGCSATRAVSLANLFPDRLSRPLYSSVVMISIDALVDFF